MKSLKLYQLLFVRLLLILLATAFAFLFYHNGLIYTAIFCGIIFLLLFASLFSFIQKTFLFYDKTISAILNNDFTTDFSRYSSFKNYKNLFELYNKLKDKQNEQVSKEMVYSSILNSIETGVIILHKQQEEWDIFLMNDYFSKHFTVPKVSKWRYLKTHIPQLCSVIEERNFDEMKTSLQIRIDRQDNQTFILQTSKTKTYEQEYYIILLDSIQKVIEKKEKDAWLNLMKVISHELMNSITPIRSLTQNLNELIQRPALSKEDMEDIRQSINTIIHRSDHLQHFVESYRKLAMLPSPDKQYTELKDLIEGTLLLLQPLFKNDNIRITNAIDSNRRLFVDRLQLEQVVINLLTNSIYAVKDKADKHITITSEYRNNRVFIIISDNGNGIAKEIEDKIFLPFFTTRKDGAGIGLTLSKNIIEAHGGYLNYQLEKDNTKFVICLMEQ